MEEIPEMTEAVWDTCLKLLALAVHKDTPPHEAELAMAKLKEILAKHNKDLAELHSKTGQTMNETAEMTTIKGRGRQMRSWERTLASGIVRAFDGRCVIGPMGDHWLIHFICQKGDMPIVTHFFKGLRREVHMGAKANYSSVADKNAYSHGMVGTISKRMTELYGAIQEMMPSDVLALVPAKQQAAEDLQNRTFSKLRTNNARASMKGSHKAWQHGRDDGNKVGLGRPVGGGATRQSIK
jgi:hypothetical protein